MKTMYGIGFDNPREGFGDGPFDTLEEALQTFGSLERGEKSCYIYRLTEHSSKRIRKWNFVEDKWEFIK